MQRIKRLTNLLNSNYTTQDEIKVSLDIIAIPNLSYAPSVKVALQKYLNEVQSRQK